jgi:exodeoxyribonuclease VII large subunit
VGVPLDLFGAASAEGAWTVSEVTRRARAVIEQGLPPLWVRGEITGFKAYRSGHWYFTLRDATAQLRCVMWSNDNRRLPTAPADGLQAFVFGRPTVWDERGEFRLTVVELLSTEAGGLWQLALEKAKAALQRDGLLDPARKRPLPAYPRRIAVVTSPDGAALKDILAVTARRWPIAEIVVVAATVQGDIAERQLVRALAAVDRIVGVDVAIVGRGGGSKEDLQAFNSERVARAVARCSVPVISAVGHETDVTLCDLVADARAATPSAAAEAATPDRTELLAGLATVGSRLARSLSARAQRAVDRLERTRDRLHSGMGAHLERSGARLTAHGAQLDALSPLKILARGYAVARNADGHVLRQVAQLPEGLAFRLRVTDGEVRARVTE